MMELRRLNEVGIEGFVAFLDALSTEPATQLPATLLTDPLTSQPLGTDAIEIAVQLFANRLELAEYLHSRLQSLEHIQLRRDRGIWTWLTLFYFDQLCPAGTGGRRRVGERWRYIPALSDWQKYYRHLLAGPYWVYWAHRENPARLRALLANPVDQPGELYEQLASRQELATSRTVMEATRGLYLDETTQRLKRGSGGKGRGSARRFADVLLQLALSWDLELMTADSLLAVLPQEFDRFRLTQELR